RARVALHDLLLVGLVAAGRVVVAVVLRELDRLGEAERRGADRLGVLAGDRDAEARRRRGDLGGVAPLLDQVQLTGEAHRRVDDLVERRRIGLRGGLSRSDERGHARVALEVLRLLAGLVAVRVLLAERRGGGVERA